MSNRKHFLSFEVAPTFEDAQFLAPAWATAVLKTDDGWILFEHAPVPDVWEGRV